MLLRAMQFVVLAVAATAFAESTSTPVDDQPPESLALIAQARHVGDLRSTDSEPFELRAHIQAAVTRKKISGEYALVWLTPDRWREELQLGDFIRLRVGTAGGYHQVRSADYQQAIIFEFDNAMDEGVMLKLSDKEGIGIPQVRRIGDSSMTCIDKRVKEAAVGELCFDSATGSFMHFRSLPNPQSHLQNVFELNYSQLEDLGGKKVPRSVEFKLANWFAVQVSVTELKLAKEVNPALFAVPPHSEFWSHCRESKSAELVDRKMPEYPLIARQHYQQGIVTLYARIEPDGSASHLFTLSSPNPVLEGAARQAVQSWKYKPVTCGGVPVRDETVIDVKFELR